MKIDERPNEYGTTISVHICETCGNEFTVCPSVSANKLDQWENCLSVFCASYDPARDVEWLFDNPMTANLILKVPTGKNTI